MATRNLHAVPRSQNSLKGGSDFNRSQSLHQKRPKRGFIFITEMSIVSMMCDCRPWMRNTSTVQKALKQLLLASPSTRRKLEETYPAPEVLNSSCEMIWDWNGHLPTPQYNRSTNARQLPGVHGTNVHILRFSLEGSAVRWLIHSRFCLSVTRTAHQEGLCFYSIKQSLANEFAHIFTCIHNIHVTTGHQNTG